MSYNQHMRKYLFPLLMLVPLLGAIAQTKKPVTPDTQPGCNNVGGGAPPNCPPDKCPDGCGIFGVHLQSYYTAALTRR